ncbi:MAG: alpha-L-fucosidase, partial [Gemmatimonadota bacterium]
GFRTLILTAKHHDGFALWPSRYTDHSVHSSPWRGGDGDVVRALAEAVRAEGLKLGVYLSPWDMHEPTYGDEVSYNQFYLGQLRELLSNYGPVAEVWFDGAKGPDAADMDYDFAAYWALVRQLQPNAVIFSDEGPDVRWIGNEHGFAGETNWSMLDRSRVSVGVADSDYLNSGDPEGPDWVPGECDVSIRAGWFWHADQEPKTLEALLQIYFKSVGRNCVLLLNVPPNREGRLDPADVLRLNEFRAALDTIFARDIAAGKRAAASNVRGASQDYSPMQALDGDLNTYWATDDTVMSAWLEVDLDEAVPFNVVRIQEPIQLGQRVSAYRVQAEIESRWRTVHAGTTIGHKKLDQIETITASRVRLLIDRVRANPLIAEFGIHFDPGR